MTISVTEHKSTDELELLISLQVALVGLCKSLPAGEKTCAYFSLLLYSVL